MTASLVQLPFVKVSRLSTIPRTHVACHEMSDKPHLNGELWKFSLLRGRGSKLNRQTLNRAHVFILATDCPQSHQTDVHKRRVRSVPLSALASLVGGSSSIAFLAQTQT